MSTELCQFCTLPATRHATINGKHYPRLCMKHFRQLYNDPSDMPKEVEHDD